MNNKSNNSVVNNADINNTINENNNNIKWEKWQREDKVIAEKRKVARKYSLVGHGEREPIIITGEREKSRELSRQISDLGKSIFVHSVVRIGHREGDTSEQDEGTDDGQGDEGLYSTNGSIHRLTSASTASSDLNARKSRFSMFGYRKKDDKRESNLSESRGSNLSIDMFKARQSQNGDIEFHMPGASPHDKM